MKIAVLTLYPLAFPGPLGVGVLGRALDKNIWSLTPVDIRDFATDRHGSVDAPAAGGGSGMVLMAPVVHRALSQTVFGKDVPADALADFLENNPVKRGPKIVYLSARGQPVTQEWVRRCSQSFVKKAVQKGTGKITERLSIPPISCADRSAGVGGHFPYDLVLICGRFEGIDQRVLKAWSIEEVTVGDMVMAGGEVPAMALIEAVVRLLPGVLGNAASCQEESFEEDLLEYPHYTKPQVWAGQGVPDVLLSGHHKRVHEWRHQQRLQVTQQRRPDVWARYQKNKNAKPKDR